MGEIPVKVVYLPPYPIYLWRSLYPYIQGVQWVTLGKMTTDLHQMLKAMNM